MTPEVLVGLAIVLIPAVASVIVSLVNHSKLTTLEVSINGRLTQLLAVNGQAARAEGQVAASMDSTAIATVISSAMAQAIAMTPPGTTSTDTVLATDTNSRVRNIQDDAAAVAAALIVKNAASIAAALVVKTAEDAAALARPDQ